MADDRSIADLIRSKATGNKVPATPVDTTALDPAPEQSRAFTRQLLGSLGYDRETLDGVAPVDPASEAAYATMPTDSLNHLGAAVESQQLQPDPTVREKLTKFLGQHDDQALAGLASANQVLNDLSESVGERAGKVAVSGLQNMQIGMAQLDVFTRLDNWLKLHFVTDDEKRAAMRLKYLPTDTLRDPRSPEFNTSAEMAVWLAGKKLWGGLNDIAALPPEYVGKLLGALGMEDVDAYLQDLASRDKQVGEQARSFVAGQLPTMIAGMAPPLSYQDIFESRFDPQQLDDIYAQFDDPGAHGPATAAAISGLGTIADFYASPLVVATSVAAGLTKFAPAIVRAGLPQKAAQLTSEIARGTRRYEDALEAVKSARNVTARAEKALQAAGKNPSTALVNDLVKAQKAQAREELWLGQFSDPGEYEPIMLRSARRNPEYIPEPTETQYELTSGRAIVREKSATEQSLEKTLADQRLFVESLPTERGARARALREGATLPVDWQNPKQITLGEKEKRILMGPGDAEYAGDAINMLVRGATIDDVVAASGLTPEYHILPDVATSLVDIRKIEKANQTQRGRQAVAAITADEAGLARSSRELLDQHEQLVRATLKTAKATKDENTAKEMRAALKLISGTRAKLPEVAEDVFEPKFVPAKTQGVMGTPANLNRWLEVAGDRVLRSLYPGGLMLHGWESKLGQFTGMAREPMRYYQSYDPAAWERIRSGVTRFDSAHKAASELVTKLMEGAGIMTKRTQFNPAKHFAPYKLNATKNEQLAKMLDTVVGTEEHAAAAAGATPEMQRAHDTIRTVFDHMADLQGISNTERYLAGYFRHMWDPSMFENGARPLEFVGVPQRAELLVSHLLHRSGAEDYKLDAALALDLYLRAAYRKLHMEPVYKDIIQTGIDLASKHGNRAHISYANDLVSQMKGKPSFVGAKIDEAIAGAWNSGGGIKVPFRDKKVLYRPGDLDRTLMGTFSLLHSGLTTGPHYAILQIASGLATSAGRFGPLATMRGVFQFATKEGQQLGKAAGTYKPFVDFMESPTFRKFTEAVQSKVRVPPLWISNSMAEDASRGIVYNVAMSHYMRKAGFKTLAEARQAGFLKRIRFEAMRSSEEINHLYGHLGRSPWVTRVLGSTASTGATQLLSYIPKQTEELLSQASRNPGYILQYLAFSGQLMRMAALAGIDMTRDVGVGYLPSDPTDITSPAIDAAFQNMELQEALANGDAEGVQKAIEALARMLPGLIPGQQVVLAGSKAIQRLIEGTVRSRSGEPLYRMQMGPDSGSGLGGEFVPTALLQRNIRETLVRRGVQAAHRREREMQYNASVAIDNYVDAVERKDPEAAQKLANELANVYNIRMANPAGSAESAIEARSMAYTLRNLREHPLLLDEFWRIYQQHNVPIQP